jgi:hypothetical protein
VALAGAAQADEEKIDFDELPKAVIKAIKAKFPRAEIKEAVEEEGEDGATTYEVSLEFKGHAYDVALKPNGTIVEVEKEIEIDELPKAVTAALAAKHPEAKIEKAELVTKGSAPAYYELVITTEVLFSAKGKLIEPGTPQKADETAAAKGKKSKKESKEEDEDEDKPHSKARKSTKVEKDEDDDEHEKPHAKARKARKHEDGDEDEMKDDDDVKKSSARARKARKHEDEDEDEDEMKDDDDAKKSSARTRKAKEDDDEQKTWAKGKKPRKAGKEEDEDDKD